MALPKISIIIPVYNSEKFIADAINSLLDQGIENLEIICVDGSSDNSAQIIKSFGNKVRYFYQEKSGTAAARNFGLANAKAEYIGFLDSDDIYPPNKLKRQLSILEANPSAFIVSGKVKYVFLEGSNPDKFQFEDGVMENYNLLIGSALYRRTLFDKIGSFDTSFAFGDDSDWHNRIKESCITIIKDNELSLIYRHHTSNITNDTAAVRNEIVKVIKRSLDRKRNLNKNNV